MAYFARDEYTATAGQQTFSISFPYLDSSHVVVVVDNGEALTENNGFTFTSDTVIQLDNACSGGETVVIYRSSSPDERLVDWTSASTITEADLDLDSYQAFFLSQEAFDWAQRYYGVFDENDNVDVASRRIVNLSNPVDNTDAVNKAYVDALVVAAGNVPSPTAGEIGYVLAADDVDSWVWEDLSALLGSAAFENIGTEEGEIPVLQVNGELASYHIPVMIGDTGSGGVSGAVPAPAAGDAAAGKYLSAGGTWSTPGGVPVGVVLPYSGSTAPSGWLLANGQAVSRTTYADLYAVVGTTYGSGDGSTTFNLPDLRGRVPMGKDNMGGADAGRVTSASTNGTNADTLGGVGGSETHTLTEAQMPTHNHTVTASATLRTGTGGSGANTASASVGTTSVSYSCANAGSGNAHSNTQPWIALNYIIKY